MINKKLEQPISERMGTRALNFQNQGEIQKRLANLKMFLREVRNLIEDQRNGQTLLRDSITNYYS